MKIFLNRDSRKILGNSWGNPENSRKTQSILVKHGEIHGESSEYLRKPEKLSENLEKLSENPEKSQKIWKILGKT